MIEQKLVPGRYLNWTVPSPRIIAGADGDVVMQPPALLAIEESSGVFSKTSNVMPMAVPHRKVHRNFQWVDYCAGKTVVAPFGGTDVITGEMSGCYVIVYQEGANKFVVHVGTDSASQERTDAVKQGWRDILTRPDVRILAGFNPARYWIGDFPRGTGDYTVGVMLAVVTTTLDLYGVLVYKASGAGKTGVKIGKSQKFSSCSTEELSTLPSKAEAMERGYFRAGA